MLTALTEDRHLARTSRPPAPWLIRKNASHLHTSQRQQPIGTDAHARMHTARTHMLTDARTRASRNFNVYIIAFGRFRMRSAAYALNCCDSAAARVPLSRLSPLSSAVRDG